MYKFFLLLFLFINLLIKGLFIFKSWPWFSILLLELLESTLLFLGRVFTFRCLCRPYVLWDPLNVYVQKYINSLHVYVQKIHKFIQNLNHKKIMYHLTPVVLNIQNVSSFNKWNSVVKSEVSRQITKLL